MLNQPRAQVVKQEKTRVEPSIYRGCYYREMSNFPGQYVLLPPLPLGSGGQNWLQFMTDEEEARRTQKDMRIAIDRAHNGVMIRPKAGFRADLERKFAENTRKMLMSD